MYCQNRMCLALPNKITSINLKEKSKKINLLDPFGKRKEVENSLVRVKKGDYVILQNKIIVRKINTKEAKEIISLFDIPSKARYRLNKK